MAWEILWYLVTTFGYSRTIYRYKNHIKITQTLISRDLIVCTLHFMFWISRELYLYSSRSRCMHLELVLYWSIFRFIFVLVEISLYAPWIIFELGEISLYAPWIIFVLVKNYICIRRELVECTLNYICISRDLVVCSMKYIILEIQQFYL